MSQEVWKPEEHSAEENRHYINTLLSMQRTEQLGLLLLDYCKEKELI